MARYFWADNENGFTVEDTLLGGKVGLTCDGYSVKVELLSEKPASYSVNTREITFPILSKHFIWSAIVNRLYAKNHADKAERVADLLKNESDQKIKKRVNGKTAGIAKSQIRKTQRMLGKTFKEHYDKVIGTAVSDKVMTFNKKLFRAIGPSHYLTKHHHFIRKSFFENNPYYINDVINYPAAAIVIYFNYNNYDKWFDHYTPSVPTPTNQKIFRKNLMKLPPCVSLSIISRITRERRVFPKHLLMSPIHFKFWVFGSLHDEIKYCFHQDCLELSTVKQYQRAAKLVGRHLHCKFDLRKRQDCVRLCEFLIDCPEPAGRVVALAERSIAWHRRQAEETIKLRLKMTNLDSETAKPPIELPKNENIKFLATIKDIFDEGISMGHCIASYAERAVKGSCYLFHIEYKGERASAEIRKEGYIAQIQGPNNRKNKACVYGEKVFREWVQGFNKQGSNIVEDIPF